VVDMRDVMFDRYGCMDEKMIDQWIPKKFLISSTFVLVHTGA